MMVITDRRYFLAYRPVVEIRVDRPPSCHRSIGGQEHCSQVQFRRLGAPGWKTILDDLETSAVVTVFKLSEQARTVRSRSWRSRVRSGASKSAWLLTCDHHLAGGLGIETPRRDLCPQYMARIRSSRANGRFRPTVEMARVKSKSEMVAQRSPAALTHSQMSSVPNVIDHF